MVCGFSDGIGKSAVSHVRIVFIIYKMYIGTTNDTAYIFIAGNRTFIPKILQLNLFILQRGIRLTSDDSAYIRTSVDTCLIIRHCHGGCGIRTVQKGQVLNGSHVIAGKTACHTCIYDIRAIQRLHAADNMTIQNDI